MAADHRRQRLLDFGAGRALFLDEGHRSRIFGADGFLRCGIEGDRADARARRQRSDDFAVGRVQDNDGRRWGGNTRTGRGFFASSARPLPPLMPLELTS